MPELLAESSQQPNEAQESEPEVFDWVSLFKERLANFNQERDFPIPKELIGKVLGDYADIANGRIIPALLFRHIRDKQFHLIIPGYQMKSIYRPHIQLISELEFYYRRLGINSDFEVIPLAGYIFEEVKSKNNKNVYRLITPASIELKNSLRIKLRRGIWNKVLEQYGIDEILGSDYHHERPCNENTLIINEDIIGSIREACCDTALPIAQELGLNITQYLRLRTIMLSYMRNNELARKKQLSDEENELPVCWLTNIDWERIAKEIKGQDQETQNSLYNYTPLTRL
jgi:hypothetical protein